VSFSVDNEGAKKEHSIEITRPFKYLCVVAQSDDDGVVSFVVAIRFSEEGSNLLVGKLSLSPEGALESALTSEDD